MKTNAEPPEKAGRRNDGRHRKMAAAWAVRRGLVLRPKEASGQALEALATEGGFEQLLERVLRGLGQRMGAQRVSLWLRDEASGFPLFHLSVKGGRVMRRPDAGHPVVENPALLWEDPLGEELLRTKQPVLCLDVAQDPRLAQRREYLLSAGTRTLLVLPLLVAGEVIGFVSLRCARQRKFRTAEIELAQALAQPATLAVEMGRIAEQRRQVAVLEERNRMARDIHDTLAQGFTGVILYLELASQAIQRNQPEEAAKHLRRAGESARDSLAEARRSVRALRPQALEGGSLLGALDRSLQQLTAGTSLEAKVRVEGQPRPLPADWEEDLLRIGQESFTNTLKHAQADRFVARLVYAPNEIRMELSDNGRGFDPAKRERGFGLAGMEERVSRMGGRLVFESANCRGTTIRVILPHPRVPSYAYPPK